jgi:hypothetical protein
MNKDPRIEFKGYVLYRDIVFFWPDKDDDKYTSRSNRGITQTRQNSRHIVYL